VPAPPPFFADFILNLDLQLRVNPGEKESPLYVNLQQVGQYLASKPEKAKCSPAIQEIIVNAWRYMSFFNYFILVLFSIL
jgi:hypothetical protein